MTGRSPSPSRSDTSASSAHSLSYQNILNNNNNITENNEHIIMLRKHRSHNRHLDSPSPTGQVSMPSKLYFSYKISCFRIPQSLHFLSISDVPRTKESQKGWASFHVIQPTRRRTYSHVTKKKSSHWFSLPTSTGKRDASFLLSCLIKIHTIKTIGFPFSAQLMHCIHKSVYIGYTVYTYFLFAVTPLCFRCPQKPRNDEGMNIPTTKKQKDATMNEAWSVKKAPNDPSTFSAVEAV